MFSERNGFKLFLGNCDHAADLDGLQQRKITYILNMAAGEKSCQMNAEVYGDGFTCKRIAAEDNPEYDLSQHFVETTEFIDRVRRKRAAVLVHCAAGASRSATVVIAFLMQRWAPFVDSVTPVAGHKVAPHGTRIFAIVHIFFVCFAWGQMF